jgi:hypothetical protein
MSPIIIATIIATIISITTKSDPESTVLANRQSTTLHSQGSSRSSVKSLVAGDSQP